MNSQEYAVARVACRLLGECTIEQNWQDYGGAEYTLVKRCVRCRKVMAGIHDDPQRFMDRGER